MLGRATFTAARSMASNSARVPGRATRNQIVARTYFDLKLGSIKFAHKAA